MSVCNLQDNALTTLDAVRRELKIKDDDDSQDARLCDLINAWSDWAERLTGRTFGIADYTEFYAGTDSQTILIRNYPVTEVVSVTKVSNSNGSSTRTTIEADTYRIEGERRLFRNTEWAESSFVRGMTPYPRFSSKNLEIIYTGGYVLPNDANPPERKKTLPADLERAVINMISIDESQRGTSKGLSSFKISDLSWQFGSGSTDLQALHEISPANYSTIMRYRSYLL